MRVTSVTFYVKTGVRRGCLLSPSMSDMRATSVAFYVKTGVKRGCLLSPSM